MVRGWHGQRCRDTNPGSVDGSIETTCHSAPIATGVELPAQPVLQVLWRAESPLQRDLLVENHADQQSQGVLGQQAVGVWITGKMKLGHDD